MNERSNNLFYDILSIADAGSSCEGALVNKDPRSDEKRQIMRESFDRTPKNANYDRVYAVIETLLKVKQVDFCGCPKCVNDIAAFALNCLPPHYYTEGNPDTGKSREVGSPWVMVQLAVSEAVERVKENPRHLMS